ncbi:DUF6807 domain-containing protein [Sunxiuqinia sp. sy24]|uniref:DUF6807 domain-containing protein n=1 Tax=Sunxiuqinia sp. sy24 TaxID=3461495 RepID=UPI0040460A95
MRLKLSLICGLLIGTMLVRAQQELRFHVYAGDYDRSNCPVSVDLSSADLELNNDHFQLYQLDGKREVPVSSQLELGKAQRLCFVLTGELPTGKSREYVYKAADRVISDSKILLEKNQQGIKLVFNEKPILNYQVAEVYPPEGVNPLFKRSGFIHPLWSPGGEELTRIQAPDHYHHYGIWGPWTKTHIDGREVDFWNLLKGQGTVQFANFLSEVEGPVYSGFSALQQHIDFGAKGADQVALNEVLDVSAWNIDSEGKVWLIDYTSTLNSPLDSGILLDAYRYGGGIGFRATEKWTKENSSVLTSEDHDRLTADGTKARWCIVEGESVPGRSGILFMSHPSNREYPEPMRVWPVDANGGRGDVYFQFCPIRHTDWKIERGTNYSQKYRLLLFDGQLTKEQAEQYWQVFASPLKVNFDKP